MQQWRCVEMSRFSGSQRSRPKKEDITLPRVDRHLEFLASLSERVAKAAGAVVETAEPQDQPHRGGD